jgi:hypothetical protein
MLERLSTLTNSRRGVVVDRPAEILAEVRQATQVGGSGGCSDSVQRLAERFPGAVVFSR